MSDDLPHGVDGKLGREAGRSDNGKRIVHTIDPDFIVGIGRISAFGAVKYHMRNFLMAPGMAWTRVYDSLIGHLQAHWDGEDLDEESGEPHILHAAWNLMVLYVYWRNPVYHPGDDRPSMIEYRGLRYEDWAAAFEKAKFPAAVMPAPRPFEERIAAILAELQELGFHTDGTAILNDNEETPGEVLAQYQAAASGPKEVRNPSFLNDPVRAFLATQTPQKGGEDDQDQSGH